MSGGVVSNASVCLGLVVAVACTSACGEGVITFPPGSDSSGDSVQIEGEIEEVFVENALRDIVVFVYTDLDPTLELPTDLADLSSSDFESLRTVVIRATPEEDAVRRFSISNARRGRLTVVFLQDAAGDDADGQIDAEDVSGGPFDCNCESAPCQDSPARPDDTNAVAILDDRGRFDPARGGRTYTIREIRIDFPTACATMRVIDGETTPEAGDDGDNAVRAGTGSGGGGLTIGFTSR